MHPAKAFTLKHSRKIGIILALLIFASTWYVMNPASGATYTWDDEGGDGLWSTCTNWTSNTCPGASDIAYFSSTTIANSVVDASFGGSVAGIYIENGFTATVTQQINLTIGSSDYTQYDGGWVQGETTFDINGGDFLLYGGVFMTGVGTSTFEGTVDTSGGTLIASSTRTFTFDGSGSDSTFTCAGNFGGRADLNKGGSRNFTVGTGCEVNKWDGGLTVGGNITINSGAAARFGSSTISVTGLVVSGTTTASSTLSVSSITLNGTGSFEYAGDTIYITGNYTDNGADFDETGILFVFQGSTQSSTLTCSGTFSGTVDVAKTNTGTFTLASGCTVDKWDASISSTISTITISNGAIAHFGNTSIAAGLIISGTTTASGTINIDNNGFTLNSTGYFEYDGSQISIERNYTDNGGTFDATGVTLLFDGTGGTDDSTMTCSGTFSGTVDVAKTNIGGAFVLNSGCIASTTDITTTGPLTVNGILRNNGNTLTGLSLAVGNAGRLILFGSETVTTPSLNTGSVVEYEGSGTYSSLGAGYDYTNIEFTGGGTYNISNAMTVSGNFTSTNDSNFNHTSNTVTFDGTTQTLTMGNGSFNNLVISSGTTTLSTDTLDVNGFLTIAVGAALDVSVGGCGGSCNIELAGNWSNSGNYVERTGTLTLDGVSQSLTGETTFYTLSKSVAVADTLTFEAGATFTVNNVLVLSGAASNLLSLVSSAPGDIWNISASGSNDLNYLSVTDSTNIDDELLVPTNSIDGGNNTNWYIYVPPVGDGSTGGTFLQGGLELRGNVFLR